MFLRGYYQNAYVTHNLDRAIERLGEVYGLKDFYTVDADMTLSTAEGDLPSHVRVGMAWSGRIPDRADPAGIGIPWSPIFPYLPADPIRCSSTSASHRRAPERSGHHASGGSQSGTAVGVREWDPGSAMHLPRCAQEPWSLSRIRLGVAGWLEDARLASRPESLKTADASYKLKVLTMQAITVFDPATEEQIGEITDGGAEAVNQAVARARAAFNAGAWHETPPGERARIIWRIADLLEQNADELAAIDSRNVGMSRNHARNLAFAAADMVRYFSGWCTKIYGQAADLKMAGGITGQSASLHGYTIKEPVGVAERDRALEWAFL